MDLLTKFQIGQALRVCLVEGLHTTLPSGQIGDDFATRCNSVWWTTYVLDRTLSATVGAPTSVNDEQISTALPDPTECSTNLATLSLHVKLSRLVSIILTGILQAPEIPESVHENILTIFRALQRKGEPREFVPREDSISFTTYG